jgi:hypothetical protein
MSPTIVVILLSASFEKSIFSLSSQKICIAIYYIILRGTNKTAQSVKAI